jgi:cytochrome P450
MTTQLDVDTGDEQPFDPIRQFQEVAGDVRDPYPFLAEMRQQSPCHSMNVGREMGQKIDSKAPKLGQVFTVFSYEAVHEVLTDNERFSSSGYAMIMGPVMGHTILEMDAPEHPRHRALVARAFRTRILEHWRESLIERTVHELLDKVVAKGRAELVSDLTFMVPLKVISRILGLPDEDWAKFHKWSLELISVANDWERGLAASAALKDYFQTVLEDRRKNPQDDLISQLVVAEVDGHRLADDEIYPFLRLLLPAGAETTYRSSGNLLFGLLSHPDQLEAVRADRSLIPQAIEEGLRWEPPLLFIQRAAADDLELCGQQIPKGAMVAVCLGAANRDPARYPDPDTFNIFRDSTQHISFGAGPHICIGMHLARLETKAIIDGVLDRMPNLRLDPEADDPHIHGLTFRSPTSLPVLFDAS